MSGPFIVSSGLGTLNGSMVNQLQLNGFGGSGVLFVEAFLDEEMFELLIGGKLRVKEKVCAEQRTGADKAKRTAKYPAVCSKVRP